MASYGADKDTAVLIRKARRAWGTDSVRLTKGNHLQFLPPHTREIITGSLTGSQSSQRKLKSQLRKAGLAL